MNDNERKINKIDTLSEAEKEKYERNFTEHDDGVAECAVKHHHSQRPAGNPSSGISLSDRPEDGKSASAARSHNAPEQKTVCTERSNKNISADSSRSTCSSNVHHSNSHGHSGSSRSNRRRSGSKTFRINLAGKIAIVALATLIVLTSTVLIAVKMIVGDTSPAAKKMFVTTLLETGQMKGLASLFLSADEINEIVDDSKLEKFSGEINTSLIVVDGSSAHSSGQTGESGTSSQAGTTNGIEVYNITGRTFSATMMVVKDPSRITLGCIPEFGTYGKTLEEIVSAHGAIGGINGGLYYSTNNSGGTPYGVVVENGVIRRNIPNEVTGLYLIGMTEDNILVVIDMAGKSAADMENIIRERKIRDAVSWQEEATEKNNHFVSLIINGESRQMSGFGSGMNPRTAIGQRADGAILLLVTDGRGTNGHLGASASDLISIMEEYEAVNAVNLDGGSSSCMYYNNEYLRDSVTFYYRNTTWRMPYAFLIK